MSSGYPWSGLCCFFVNAIASVELLKLLKTLLSVETAGEQRATRLADVLMHQGICYISRWFGSFNLINLIVNFLSQRKNCFII